MRPLILHPSAFETLAEACRNAWPTEACGLLFGRPDLPETLRVVALENQQDKLHRADPAQHPRDGRTAYSLDPLAVFKAVTAAEAAGETLLALFHSHPQHPAYFSRTDRAAASPWGSPTFPQAWQLVASVYDGVLVDLKAFAWEPDAETWTEGPLLGLPPLPGPPPGALPLADDPP